MSSLGAQSTQGTPGLVPRRMGLLSGMGWAGLVCPRGLVGMSGSPGLTHPGYGYE